MAERPEGATLLKHTQTWELDVGGVKVTLHSDRPYRIKHDSPSWHKQVKENGGTKHLCGPLYPINLRLVDKPLIDGKVTSLYEVVLDSHPGQDEGGWYGSHVLDLWPMLLPGEQGQTESKQKAWIHKETQPLPKLKLGDTVRVDSGANPVGRKFNGRLGKVLEIWNTEHLPMFRIQFHGTNEDFDFPESELRPDAPTPGVKIEVGDTVEVTNVDPTADQKWLGLKGTVIDYREHGADPYRYTVQFDVHGEPATEDFKPEELKLLAKG
jgi:hypothetical protein